MEIKTQLKHMKIVVSVVSNIYTILKYDKNYSQFRLSQYFTGFPLSNTNFKNIYSGVGIFVGIKNNNTAVIWEEILMDIMILMKNTILLKM